MRILSLLALLAFVLNTEGTINICIPLNSTKKETVDDLRESLKSEDDQIYIGHLDFDFVHPAVRAHHALRTSLPNMCHNHHPLFVQLPSIYNLLYNIKYMSGDGQTEYDTVISDLHLDRKLLKRACRILVKKPLNFSAKGYADNLTITNIFRNFELCIMDIHWGSQDLFNLTFPVLNLKGNYSLNGSVADLFLIWGTGPFYVNISSFSIAVTNWSMATTDGELCMPITVDLNLVHTDCHFYNFMDDPELEDLMSDVFAQISGEAMKIIWEELKEIYDEPLEEFINKILYGVKFLKKLHKAENNLGIPLKCYDQNDFKQLLL